MSNVDMDARPARSHWFQAVCVLELFLVAGALFLCFLFPAIPAMLVLVATAIAMCVLGFFLAMKRRIVLSLVVLTPVTITLGYLLFWPVPFDPVAGPKRVTNPAGTGIFSKNNALAAAQRLVVAKGPESIELDASGRIYTGLADGRIIRLTTNGDIEELANTGGRPLGIQFDAVGNLIIADAEKGLLSLSEDGTLTTLTTEVDGQRMIFVDDLAIATDGRIFFSDASQHFRYGEETMELFERRPSGRLLVYDPASQETKVLIDNLYFANGVALAPDESFVIVVETFEHRIMRYWIEGPKAGTRDVFAENLPGYLDNVTEAPGGFWLAIVGPRSDEIDSLVSLPFRRTILWRLAQVVGFPESKHSYAVKLSTDATPLQSLEDDTGHIFALTSVLERDGKLYLGSHVNDIIGMMNAP